MSGMLNNIANGWFAWQVTMLWQVALLIAIVWAVDLLIRRWAWPQVRYALWLLVLVKLVLPPTLTSPASFTARIPALAGQVATVKASQAPAIERRPHFEWGEPFAPPRDYSPSYGAAANMENAAEANVKTPEVVDASVRLSWKTYAFIVWLAGIVTLSAFLAMRLRALRRGAKSRPGWRLPERFSALLATTAARLKLKRIPEVILTEKVRCPAVFGVFRPVLLMPAHKLRILTAGDAEHILLHELAHIKRGDLLVHAFYMGLQIAYWFNPLLWLVRRRLQNLRELCCDATVARLLKEKTYSYRRTLLETARQLLAEPVDPGLGLMGLFENSRRLADRLKWLEKKTWKNRPLRMAIILATVSIMAVCVIPMAKWTRGGLQEKGAAAEVPHDAGGYAEYALTESPAEDENIAVPDAHENMTPADEQEKNRLNDLRKEGWRVFNRIGSYSTDYVDGRLTFAFLMNRRNLITVRCVDKQGWPMAYCRIVFVDRGQEVRFIDDVPTNDSGYAYCDAISGPFSIMAQIFDYSEAMDAWIFRFRKIERVHDATERPTITVCWPPLVEGTGRIRGRVADQYSRPLERFDLQLSQVQGLRQGWGEFSETMIKKHFVTPDGEFQLSGLPAGVYTYMIHPDDNTAYAWDFNMGQIRVREEEAPVQLNYQIEAKQNPAAPSPNRATGNETGLKEQAAKGVSKLLAEFAGDKYRYIGDHLFAMVNEIGIADANSFLLGQLASDSRMRRCDAGLALAVLGDPRGIEAIISELSDKSYRPTEMIASDGSKSQERQIRQDHYYAALLLGILGDIRAVGPLIEATKDETIDYRAAMSLGEIGDRRAIPALRDMLARRKDDTSAQVWAGYGLAALGQPDGLEVVINVLNDKEQEWSSHRYAIWALAKLREKKAVPHLIAALKDEHPSIRVSAAEALGEIGDQSALPALEQALLDETQTEVNAPTTVSKAAAEAILKIRPGSQEDIAEVIESADERRRIEQIIQQLCPAIEANDVEQVKKLGPAGIFAQDNFDMDQWLSRLSEKKKQLAAQGQDISNIGAISIRTDEAIATTGRDSNVMTYFFTKVEGQWRLYVMDLRQVTPSYGPKRMFISWPRLKLDNEVWDEYLEAADSLHKGADRKEMAERFSSIGQRYALTRRGRVCQELGLLLTRMAEEDEVFTGPANVASLAADERIEYYSYKLRDVAEQEMFIPGKCSVLKYPRAQNSAAVALRHMGEAVVPAMIGLLEDRRPTRSVGLSRNMACVLRYCDVALEIIEDIAGRKFDTRTERGAFLSTADPELRDKIIADINQWWKQRTEEQEGGTTH